MVITDFQKKPYIQYLLFYISKLLSLALIINSKPLLLVAYLKSENPKVIHGVFPALTPNKATLERTYLRISSKFPFCTNTSKQANNNCDEQILVRVNGQAPKANKELK